MVAGIVCRRKAISVMLVDFNNLVWQRLVEVDLGKPLFGAQCKRAVGRYEGDGGVVTCRFQSRYVDGDRQNLLDGGTRACVARAIPNVGDSPEHEQEKSQDIVRALTCLPSSRLTEGIDTRLHGKGYTSWKLNELVLSHRTLGRLSILRARCGLIR